jgi:hypothetical protein
MPSDSALHERNFRHWLAQQRQVSDYLGLALELLLVTSMHCLRVVTYEGHLLEAIKAGTCLEGGGPGALHTQLDSRHAWSRQLVSAALHVCLTGLSHLDQQVLELASDSRSQSQH